MKKHSLTASIRTIVGSKLAPLRKAGKVPATIYGKNITSLSLELDANVFEKTYKEAGETGLIELTIDEKTHPVLIKNVQLDPVRSTVLHVEFHEVDLKEKIHADIPIKLVGESPAVKEGIGTLFELVREIEVEALPTDLPEYIEISIENLNNLNDQIQIKDISITGDVTMVTDPEVIIVKIGELTAPEPEPVTAEVAPEGETPADESAEAPKEEEKSESPSQPQKEE